MKKINSYILLSSLLLLLILELSFGQEFSVQASDQWKVVTKSTWQYAAKAAPRSLLQKFVQNNIGSNWLGDPGRMKIVKFTGTEKKINLYLIDTRVQEKCPPNGCDLSLNPLCGVDGCAYFAYVQDATSYRQVFSKNFNDALPPTIPFLRVSNQLVSGLPCLEFTELIDPTNSKLKSSKFCYDGKNFTLVSSQTRPYSE